MSIDTDYAVLRTILTGRPETGTRTFGPWPDLRGWAVEFGVYSGYSLSLIAAYMPVIGFDSFEGLPEDWREGFPMGTFDDAPGLCELTGPNRMIVPGLFSDTVPTFPFPTLSLVHIDCDLYSSTVTALEGVRPYIGPGTVIVFDEYHGYEGWEQHEHKAWREFSAKHHVVYTQVAHGEQERAFVINGVRPLNAAGNLHGDSGATDPCVCGRARQCGGPHDCAMV